MAGLKENNKPFISAFDLIGAPVITDDFVVGGTCTNNLYGMCESLYRPDMVSRSGSKQLYLVSLSRQAVEVLCVLCTCPLVFRVRRGEGEGGYHAGVRWER